MPAWACDALLRRWQADKENGGGGTFGLLTSKPPEVCKRTAGRQAWLCGIEQPQEEGRGSWGNQSCFWGGGTPEFKRQPKKSLGAPGGVRGSFPAQGCSDKPTVARFSLIFSPSQASLGGGEAKILNGSGWGWGAREWAWDKISASGEESRPSRTDRSPSASPRKLGQGCAPPEANLRQPGLFLPPPHLLTAPPPQISVEAAAALPGKGGACRLPQLQGSSGPGLLQAPPPPSPPPQPGACISLSLPPEDARAGPDAAGRKGTPCPAASWES